MRKLIFILLMSFCTISFAQGFLGQTIQIDTELSSFVGRPSWLIVIRDLDHNQNIPYTFDFRRGSNSWLVFTYGRNYLVTISNLQFSPYCKNPYTQRRINNFCHLESQGRIERGKSMHITLRGNLSPNANTYTCHISSYAGTMLTVAPSAE